MPADNDRSKWNLFPHSGKPSNASLNFYQTQYDRHCTECGIIVPNQVIEKSLFCPQNHVVDCRPDHNKKEKTSMLAAWGRCTYCDNFLAAHHKFCPCCGRVSANYDRLKNKRLHQVVLNKERIAVRQEINTVLKSVGIQVAIDSENQYYLSSNSEHRTKREALKAITIPTDDSNPSDGDAAVSSESGVEISEIKTKTSTPSTDAEPFSFRNNSNQENQSLNEDSRFDDEDAFLSLINTENVMEASMAPPRNSLTNAPIQDAPLSQSIQSLSQKSCMNSQASSSLSVKSTASNNNSGTDSSQYSRKLRPRPSSKKSYNAADYLSESDDVNFTEPIKKKKKQSISKNSVVDENVQKPMQQFVDLAASSDDENRQSQTEETALPKVEG